MKHISKIPRLLVLIASLLLAGAFILPIWRIELSAPQYPEGLVLQIYANGIRGNVDIINGLNHYIGMKTLHSEDFIEFTLLPYIIAGLVLLGLVTFFVNKKKLYYTFIAVFMAVAIISMVDFYRWEYNYGHELNPHAAIQVPGMAYQPPLIGYKQLLNFGAYSIPDKGGWLFISAGVLFLLAYLLILQPKWLPFKRKHRQLAFGAIILFSFQSCSSGPEAIRYGVVACDYCKMTIMDKKFAAEWVTDKNKVYRFDDLYCFQGFKKIDKSKGTAYVNDYTAKQELGKAEKMFYLTSTGVKAPMGGNIAAFITEEDRDKLAIETKGQPLSWSDIVQAQ